MRITRDHKKRTISLDQTCYVEKVVKRFGPENCKPVSVPLSTGYNPRPHSDQNSSNATLWSRYQSVIGSLLYIMLGTRPDISFAVIKMSQFSSNPTEEHLQKVLYIVFYLSSSKELCIVYSGTGDSNGLCAYSNTDWAGDVETSRSTTGYAIFLGNGIVFNIQDFHDWPCFHCYCFTSDRWQTCEVQWRWCSMLKFMYVLCSVMSPAFVFAYIYSTCSVHTLWHPKHT